jgi:hypothetical protein
MKLNTSNNYEFRLKYVKEQTPEICIEAVMCSYDAYEYVNPAAFD